jgi:hypothetical protein
MARLASDTTLAEAHLWLALMPSQVSCRHGVDVSSPERRLLLAMLAEAITTLRHAAGARSRAGQRRFVETAAWFASDATDSPFTFASICGVLGLDTVYLRSGLRHWQRFAEGAPCRLPASA